MMANDTAQPSTGSKRVPKRKKMDDYYTTTAAGQREEITSADMMRTRQSLQHTMTLSSLSQKFW